MSCTKSSSHPAKNPASPSTSSLRNESPARLLRAPPASARIRPSHKYVRDSKQTKSPYHRATTLDESPCHILRSSTAATCSSSLPSAARHSPYRPPRIRRPHPSRKYEIARDIPSKQIQSSSHPATTAAPHSPRHLL